MRCTRGTDRVDVRCRVRSRRERTRAHVMPVGAGKRVWCWQDCSWWSRGSARKRERKVRLWRAAL